MFDWEDDQAEVKSWLRDGITWQLGDAAATELANIPGPRDMRLQQASDAAGRPFCLAL